MEESQAFTALDERIFDDPSQLSQLLRQRAGSDKAIHFTTSTESRQSGDLDSTSTFAILHQLPAVHAPIHHGPSERRVAIARNVKPSLHTHHSAPTSTGLIKNSEAAQKAHRSFGGMDAPGDTQPDSQMHKDYTSDLCAPGDSLSFARNLGPKSLFIDRVENDEGDSPFNGSEVAEPSQGCKSPTATSPTILHEDDVLGAIPHEYALTSPFKFETPAINHRRLDNSAQMLSSAMRTETTPGTVISTSAFPGFAIGVSAPMSLTQAWQNTQAPTSPAQAEAAEDAAFTRPSPNFTHARQSSPIPALSSPIKAMRDENPRTDPVFRSSSEPQAEYISMKESQERRKHIAAEHTSQTVDQVNWDRLSPAQIRHRKKKLKEDLERKAAMTFAHISAPPLPSSERRGRRMTSARVSPPNSTRPARRGSRVHHNENESTNALVQPNTTNRHDNDLSPDELSPERAVIQHKNRENRVQVPKTSSHPIKTQSGQSAQSSSQIPSASSQLQLESQLQAPASQALQKETLRRRNSRESSAVMDSQPDATADYGSIPRPKSLRFPSSPSINEYSINQTTMATKTGYTSQVVSSSMPPMPPKSSPDEEVKTPEEDITPEGEERVPSSPPNLTHEDDLTYDEHDEAYNEYAGEIGVRDSTEREICNDDIVMDEEDDLPLANAGSDDEEATGMRDTNIRENSEPDLIQPRKIGRRRDQRISQTLEIEALLPEDGNVARSLLSSENHFNEGDTTPRPPRGQRQATIPETDALEETQPSFFPNTESARNDRTLARPTDESGKHNPINSTDPLHPTQEQPYDPHHSQPLPASSKEDDSEIIQSEKRLRSLQDIHNLPDTQPMVEADIEMPRLSGLDDNDGQTPSPKRRRVTYGTKRNAFRSSVKQNASMDTTGRQPPSSTVNSTHRAPEDDLPTASAQEREQQGAQTVAQVREEAQALYTKKATLKSKAAPKTSKRRIRKKGALKSVPKELLQALSSPGNLLKPKATTRSRTTTPITPTKRDNHRKDTGDYLSMLDDEERDELADPTPEPANDMAIIKTAVDRGEPPAGDIIVPNRVLAAWPGKHYFPATCLGRVDGRQLQIRFDDGNTTNIDASHVRALDLYPDDLVKVDEIGMKKHTYIIIGFKDKIDDLESEEFPTTDRHGYRNVVLEEKLRDSLPSTKAVQRIDYITVPMGSLYLTSQLWNRLRDRSFNFSPTGSPSKHASGMGTPIISVDPTATLSFTRRGIAAPSILKDATARAVSVASCSTRSCNSVFSNMAFVLTSTAADVDKETIAKIIKTNGGQVLEQGFHELFDYESSDALVSSQGRRESTTNGQEPVGLSLKPTHKGLGFVALLSDSHSRSTKYIQALALNVPCLHLRWVQDSVSASRAVAFARYLLPAGVSKFLDPNGVIRSRTMVPYDPSSDTLTFAQTISARDLLLHSQSVLLVTGKSKKEIEKRQPFIFLTHALGSSAVGRCTDLNTAAQNLKDNAWNWVYVDNGEQGVAEAAEELFGARKPAGGKPKKGKKRRREEGEEREALVARGRINGREVKITCAEFVIQSLILGALVEE